MSRLRNAREDFLERTIANVPGTLGKICFFSEITSGSRGYEHWGLTRTFGEQAAQAAMAEAHTEIFLQELRTPLRELWSELQSKSQEENTSLEKYSEMLERAVAHLPLDLAGGSEKHHHYIFITLTRLARNRRSTRRGA